MFSPVENTDLYLSTYQTMVIGTIFCVETSNQEEFFLLLLLNLTKLLPTFSSTYQTVHSSYAVLITGLLMVSVPISFNPVHLVLFLLHKKNKKDNL